MAQRERMATEESGTSELPNGEEDITFDLADPSSIAEGMDNLTEEQIEELLQQALAVNKKLKRRLRKQSAKQELNAAKYERTAVPNMDAMKMSKYRTILPPIDNSKSLIAKEQILTDFKREKNPLVK